MNQQQQWIWVEKNNKQSTRISSSVPDTNSHLALRNVASVLKIAKKDHRSIESVGAETFGSKKAFQEAFEVYERSQQQVKVSTTRLTELPPAKGTSSKSQLPAQKYKQEDPTLSDMVRHERLGINNDMDAALVSRITKDPRFKDSVDYLDSEADRLAGTSQNRNKHHKRRHPLAMDMVQAGYESPNASSKKRHKITSMDDLVHRHKALSNCQLCFRDGGLPDYPTIVALGIHTYLVLTPYCSVSTCQIVPVNHMVSTLEGDDEFWNEVRNFQKCLMHMYANTGQHVIFSEVVLDIEKARHTYIDVIPVSPQIYNDAPGIVRTAMQLDAEEHEWTQHASAINTRIRTNDKGLKTGGGFRGTMVPNLPYIHVWYDLDGGHGHVIEERSRYVSDQFVREIFGMAMDVDSLLYRKQKWLPRQENHDRVRDFVIEFAPYDWTSQLEGGRY